MDLYQLNGVSRTSGTLNGTSRVRGSQINGTSRVSGSQMNEPSIIFLPGGEMLNGKGKDRRQARRAARKGKKLARVDRREIRKANRQERGELRMQKRRDGTSFLDTVGKSLADISGGIGAEKMAGAALTQADADAVLYAAQGGGGGYDDGREGGSTAMEWLEENWYYVAGGAALAGVGLYLALRKPAKKGRR